MTEIYLIIGLIIGIAFAAISIAATGRFGLETIIFMAVAIFAWPIALILALTRSE